MGSRGPDCGTHSPSGVTSSRTSAPTVEFWRFSVRGKSSSSIWAGKPAKLGLRSRPEELGWTPNLPGSPPQAGRLQTWTVSGLSPSHCPRLLALARHTTCRSWTPSPQVTEHCRGETGAGGVERQWKEAVSSAVQPVPRTERGQRRVPSLCWTRGTCKDCSQQPLQDSTATVKYSCTRWERATALILEPPEPSHHLEGACGTPFRHYCLCSLCLACACVLKYFVYHPAAIH